MVDAVGKSVTEKMVDGTLWMFFAKFIERSLGLISTLILLRLLSPDDFGLVAMAMVVYGFVDILVAFGFDVALIQKKDVSRDHYDSAWTLRLIFYFITAVVLASVAPLSSRYFNDERLMDIVFCLSFVFLLSAMTNIGVVEFRRNLEFKKEFWFSVAKKSVALLVTVPLAYYLRSYWALVIGMLTSKFVEVCISYWVHSFRPRLNLSKYKGIMRFSRWMLLNSILGFISTSLPNFVLGRFFGASVVGYYSVSSEVINVSTTEVVSAINRSTLPGYSKKIGNLTELRRSYFKVMSVIAFITWPVGFGILSVLDVLIPVVFGEGWIGTVGFFVWLTPAAMLLSLISNAWVLNAAIGRPEMTTYIDLCKVFSLSLLMFLLFDSNDYFWVSKSIFLSSVFTFIVGSVVVSSVLESSVLLSFKENIRPLGSSFIMFLVVSWFVDYMLPVAAEEIVLGLSVVLGVFIYSFFTVLFWALWGSQEGVEVFFFNRIKSLCVTCR